MNISSTSDNKFTSFLLHFLPEKVALRSLSWASLPIILFFVDLLVASTQNVSLTPYLGLIFCAGTLLTLRFQIVGLLASYSLFLLLLLSQEPTDRLWQLISCSTFALTLFIVMTVREEIYASTQQQEASFEEEIKKLKEEAEQRRIEKNALSAQLEQVQKEWEHKLHAAQTVSDQQRENLIAAQEEIIRLQQKPKEVVEVIKEVVEVVKEQDSKAMGLYNQLRLQFQEKSQTLNQTRRELFHAQTKLEALEKEQAQLALDPPRAEAAHFESEMNKLVLQLEALEQEVIELELLISSILR